jgi:hypothetical protein
MVMEWKEGDCAYMSIAEHIMFICRGCKEGELQSGIEPVVRSMYLLHVSVVGHIP